MKKSTPHIPRIRTDTLPRIAYVGAESLTPSQGTGMMFKRHFSRYPKEKIIDLHFRALTEQKLFPKIFVRRHDLRHASWTDPWMRRLNDALSGGASPARASLLYQHHTFEPLAIDWRSRGGPPELIYSTCYSAEDFAFLHHVHRSLPKRVPIVQHFLDLNLDNYDNLVKLYLELFPAMAASWALTDNIANAVAKFSFQKPEIVQALHQPLAKNFRKTYRNFHRNFDSVVIGNIWSGTAYSTLEKIWGDCQKKNPLLPPIQWAGHPRRFLELKKSAIEFNPRGPAIRDLGYFSDQGLRQRLRNADLALIAFSGSEVDQEHYTNYSLPSRIGDYCALGIPLVVISKKGTPPWRLVQENKLGLALDPGAHRESVKILGEFILHKAWREACGRNARKYAEREFNLSRYQEKLYPRLGRLAKFKVPNASLATTASRLWIAAAHLQMPQAVRL